MPIPVWGIVIGAVVAIVFHPLHLVSELGPRIGRVFEILIPTIVGMMVGIIVEGCRLLQSGG